MPEKGTLCHAATRLETCVGASRLHGLILGGGEVGCGGGRKPLVCFEWKYCVSMCKLKFMFPCVNVIPIQSSP